MSRLVMVWIVVAVVVFSASATWLITNPLMGEFEEHLNSSDINTTEIADLMDDRTAYLYAGLDSIYYLIIVVIIAWGFMWMQQKETITGRI